MPNYVYTSDNYLIKVKARVGTNAAPISDATVDVWNPAGTKVVNAAAATVLEDEASYLVSTSNTVTAGEYTYEVHVTYAGGYGVLTYQGTFTITARKV